MDFQGSQTMMKEGVEVASRSYYTARDLLKNGGIK
jgi:hypothetical protein